MLNRASAKNSRRLLARSCACSDIVGALPLAMPPLSHPPEHSPGKLRHVIDVVMEAQVVGKTDGGAYDSAVALASPMSVPGGHNPMGGLTDRVLEIPTLVPGRP